MSEEVNAQPPEPKPARQLESPNLIGGVVLITLGVLFLLARLLPDFSFSDYWPVMLIVIGALLLWKARKH